MSKQSKAKIWLAQTRANFLLLAVALVAIGIACALRYQSVNNFSFFHAIMILAGTVSAHISVNLFNEYSDFKTKIDFNTQRTPFSGGSGMLTNGHTKLISVKMAAITSFLFALAIGLYFSLLSHWFLLVLVGVGALAILGYTTLLAKIMLGELVAGLTLGTMVVVGSYIAMNGSPQMSLATLVPIEVWLISIPPGILTALLLLINEFPDAEADMAGGRRHLVIKLGWKKAAWVYATGMFCVYLIISLLPVLGYASYWMFLALIPAPVAFIAASKAVKYGNDAERIVPALGLNVMVVLSTDLLISVAVFIQLF